jgi:hypothetical protein
MGRPAGFLSTMKERSVNMSEKINWTLNVQVVGGPKMSASRTETVDAYDKIGVTVAAGETEVVEIQPGNAGRVQFLLISSNEFDDKLTFKVNNAGKDIALDAMQLLVGDGAVGLLPAAPKSLAITNSLADPVEIQVIVGRKAIA